MKNLSTIAIVLFFTLLVVPITSYLFGTSLGALEWEVLSTLIIIAAISIAYSFIVGEWTKNNSQVDKLWSILPIIYVWVVAYYGDFAPRLVVMAVLASAWGIRLTANFALKGAYQWRFLTLLCSSFPCAGHPIPHSACPDPCRGSQRTARFPGIACR